MPSENAQQLASMLRCAAPPSERVARRIINSIAFKLRQRDRAIWMISVRRKSCARRADNVGSRNILKNAGWVAARPRRHAGRGGGRLSRAGTPETANRLRVGNQFELCIWSIENGTESTDNPTTSIA